MWIFLTIWTDLWTWSPFFKTFQFPTISSVFKDFTRLIKWSPFCSLNKHFSNTKRLFYFRNSVEKSSKSKRSIRLFFSMGLYHDRSNALSWSAISVSFLPLTKWKFMNSKETGVAWAAPDCHFPQNSLALI